MPQPPHGRTREQFLAVLRGVPARTVALAMNLFTPGVIWSGSAKVHMADSWVRGEHGLDRVKLGAIKAKARAIDDERAMVANYQRARMHSGELYSALRAIRDTWTHTEGEARHEAVRLMVAVLAKIEGPQS